MEDFEKQILIFSIAIILGVVIVVSGAAQWIHQGSIKLIHPLFQTFDIEGRVAETIGYATELLLAALIMFTPLSAMSSPWFLKIAFELTFGKHRSVNIFVIHPFMNWVMGFICLILFGYSLYNQYQWSIKLTQTLPGKDKDLARLI